MTIALFVFYLLSHATGFAGFGLMVFVSLYEKDMRDVRYLAFLFSFFLYVALGNVAFIRASFLGVRAYFLEPGFFPAFMAVTAILMAAYSFMFHSLPKTAQSRRTLYRLLAWSCAPLALLALGYAPLAPNAPDGLRVALMRAASLSLAALLVYSVVFMVRNHKNAIDAECALMMRFTIRANAIFLLPFLAETWYNFDASRPFIPLSAESAYYFALGIANVVGLAHGVFLKRRRESAESFSARETYARAALAEERISEREKNILAYLLLGLGNKQIAAHLEMTEYMVRNDVSALLKKAGARNRVELVELYRKTLSR